MTELEKLLDSAGIKVTQGRSRSGSESFALSIALEGDQVLQLGSQAPPFVGAFSQEAVGLATFDTLGRVGATWGLATRIPFLITGQNLLASPLADLLRFGGSTDESVLVDGYRFLVSAPDSSANRFVLVIEAKEELQAKRQAVRNERVAFALKRLGKTLTMNQNREPLCLAATHELSSALELAACLLWLADPNEEHLELHSSVGATRRALTSIRSLKADGSSCAAEIAAATRKPLFLNHVSDHALTSELEAKLCYLKPGPLSVHPLEIGGKLLGVLELVGRDGDVTFHDSKELFETIAEHLALAINAASLYENMEKLASHDPLTGLPNHRFMQDFLHARVHEAVRTGQSVGLMMIDVDHFRAFNEEEGHDAGDEVLRMLADALRFCIRPYDIAARYGGEEFVVIMAASDLASTTAIAERLRGHVDQKPFVTKSGRRAHVSVSVGTAALPETAGDANDLLKAADIALYEAKRGGRNRVVQYTGAYQAEGREQLVSVESLRGWLSEEDWNEGLTRIERRSGDLAAIQEAIGLTHSQVAILNSLLLIGPHYREWSANQSVQLEAACSAEEFRALLPNLQSLEERFDGTGPRKVEGKRIPLLGRVLKVLLSVEEGVPLFDDPGLFDPEILGLVGTLHRAA